MGRRPARRAFYAALLFFACSAGSTQDLGEIAPLQPNPPDPAHWEKTPASGMRDIAIADSGTIWLVGSNGTIWYTLDGQNFIKEEKVSGFGRIGAGNDDGYVFAVGRNNGTLWHYKGPGNWYQTPASGVADVAIDIKGFVWIAGTNGTIWYSKDKGGSFKQIKASGFCRIGTHSELLWAVGCNGTLWYYKRAQGANTAWDAGEWIQTAASGIADVTASNMDSLWVTGKNGTVWQSSNRPLAPGEDPSRKFNMISKSAGFTSIAYGHGKIYAVRLDGTVWRYKP